MSRLAIDDLFYGEPERVQYVAGGGGYGGHDFGHSHHQIRRYQGGPHYYSDGDDHHSHRSPVYPSPSSGQLMLPDVQLSVPMDSQRCVKKVKEALDISGVYGIHCDVASQTVTVSGNVAPQALLKRVKHVKRKSKILSYSSPYNNSGHIAPHHGHTSSSSAFVSSYYRSGQRLSPPADNLYYSRNNHHSFVSAAGYNDQYRPSHDHHYSSYFTKITN